MNMMINYEYINDHIPDMVDLFICSASFEERCLKVAFAVDKSKIRKAIICYNSDSDSSNLDNLHTLRDELSVTDSILIELKTDEPIDNADLFVNLFAKYSKKDECLNVIIDVTTFTRETLLILTNIMRISIKGSQIYFVYAAANDYSTREDSSDKWLTKGIKNVRSILGYSGEFIASGKLHLVTLVGFEIERAIAIIDIMQPDLLSLGIPGEREVVYKNHFPINRNALKYIESSYNNKILYFNFSCKDPFTTKENIEKHLNDYKSFNTCISALNNKISTLGAALVCYDHPEVQMCYANANFYNVDSYSSPGDSCIIFKLF